MPTELLWVLTKCCIAMYPVGVVLLVSVKLILPGAGPPWPEVFYGPAITALSSFVIIALGIWLGSRWEHSDSQEKP